MNIIDISWPLSELTTAYKDKKTISFNTVKTVAKDGVCESLITLSSHSGTHIDAPAHFIDNGSTIDHALLERFMGPCKVIDMTHISTVITADALYDLDIEEDDFILFKTKNSALSATMPFNKNFVYLEASAAAYLAECAVALVGFDYLGIEREQPQHETHRLLMDADVMIVEGLRLAHVTAGAYLFVCLPLAVQGVEAAPARAVLVTDL
jgi:arylformamidase